MATVTGGNGDDSITTGSGDDSLVGNGGKDTLRAGEGHDTLRGGDGKDSLDGGDGNDSISGSQGTDTLDGGSGDDMIDGGDNSDTIYGGDGNDYIYNSDGALSDDTIYAGAGDDSVFVGSREDLIDGGAGNDQLHIAEDRGYGTVDPNDGTRDVVRLHAGSGTDTAVDFNGEDDYIYIGALDKGDIIFTQTGLQQWVLTTVGGAPGDSLTLNFNPGTEPRGKGDLRQQLIGDSEYTPPAAGQHAQWNLACFTTRPAPHRQLACR